MYWNDSDFWMDLSDAEGFKISVSLRWTMPSWAAFRGRSAYN